MFMSKSHQSYQGAATSRKQRPSGTGATREDAWPHDYHQKDAGSHDKCHQKQGTQKHSASHHPHACLGREGNACHAQPPAHLDGQRICTQPETKQAAHAPGTYGQLKVWLRHWTNACKPAMIRAQLGPFGGRRPRGSMQALPDLMTSAHTLLGFCAPVN